MKKSKNSSAPFFGFSYLDAILLLVAGLILSVGIYLHTEEKRQEQQREYYHMEVELCYEKELLPFIPQKDALLFDGEGREIGRVESVRTTDEEGRVIVNCLVEEGSFYESDSFTLETSSSVKRGKVLSSEKVLNEKGDAV